MDEKKRVAIYARVSTTEQAAENQLLDLRAYCAARRWEIIGEFVDSGISGAKKDRPNLDCLMAIVRKRLCDCVLVWRFDRFARSLSHLVNTLEYFRERGVEFASYQEGVDTSTAQGKMVFGVMASLAEFERELIRERIHAGLRRARSKGKRLGRPSRLSSDQIAELYRRRAAGESLRAIAASAGLSKSRIQMIVSSKPIPNAGYVIDEAPVALSAG